MDKAYCTVAEIENYLGIDIDASLESQVDNWILGISNYISLYTNREWLADAVASDRFFDGSGFMSLEVGDFIEISNVYLGDSFGDNFVEETDYITYPHNTTVKNTIILKNNSFEEKIKNVKITARWGYSATVPEDIKLATVILVAGVYNAQRNNGGEIKSEKIGNYSVSYTTDEQVKDYERAKESISQRRLTRI